MGFDFPSIRRFGVVVGVILITGCGTTLMTKTNIPVQVDDNSGGLIFNDVLVKEGAVSPKENFEFRGVNTGGGREALIKEIAGITANARKRYQEGSYSLLKHDIITTYAEYLLVAARNLMREEARGNNVRTRVSSAFAFAVRAQPQSAAVERANNALREASTRMSTRAPNAEDPILDLLKATVDLLHALEEFPFS